MKLYKLFSECLSIPYLKVGVSANYAIKKEKEALYIFFEGSDGESDWKSNLDFPAKPYKRMGKTAWFAHRGFLEVWKEIEPMIAKEIKDLNIKRIITTGYSHGAAIAVLCHEYIWFNRHDLRENIEGYGFGCPRVLWGIKSEDIKRRWERFTVIRNIDDAVTHLPPSLLGYFHVGKLLEIGKKGKYTPIEAHYEQNILKELRLYESAKPFQIIDRHQINNNLSGR